MTRRAVFARALAGRAHAAVVACTGGMRAFAWRASLPGAARLGTTCAAALALALAAGCSSHGPGSASPRTPEGGGAPAGARATSPEGASGGPGAATSPVGEPFARATAGAQRHDGYIPFYYSERTGKLLLQPRLDEQMLLLNSLTTGVGSWALGLDRGNIGEDMVVHFERHGTRVLLVRENTAYRALEGGEGARRAVAESFPTSVLGSFPIVAEGGTQDAPLVDATDFFLQDLYDVRGKVRRAGQGDLRLDRDRGAIWAARTKAFPENTEVEALLTFASENPGRELEDHAPDARSLSLREHYSFVKLPGPGYTPRAFDPRVGLFPVAFYDFGLPFDREPVRRWISRWRLQKQDPAAAISEPVKPIVYYLDQGIPEPVRSAVREGALWWNRVFEAAGFRNAFQVKDLPLDVDPMDARYSVIEWVDRSDPGFSVGPSFRDPRTGEIIKAVVRLEENRSYTDYNIWAGATSASVGDGAPAGGPDDLGQCDYADPLGASWLARLDPEADAAAFALARRRQHAAHEVGHTFGLAHNFVAHAYDGRASVMDYPGPLMRLRDGHLDLSDAYRDGPGVYDSLAIRYAYTEFPDSAAERAGLAAIVRAGLRAGTRFITDADADTWGSIPEATRWLNGSDIVAELDRVTAVRDYLLAHFGEGAIHAGEPLFLLGDRLGPVYLAHRYTLEAAVKAVGGMDYDYSLRGDAGTAGHGTKAASEAAAATRILEPALQRAVLSRLVAAMQPAALAIPEQVLRELAPPPYGYRRGFYSFTSPAAPAFDQLAAARTLVAGVADQLLDPRRIARLAAFHARDALSPSPEEVIGSLVDGTWGAGAGAPRTAADAQAAALLRVSQRAVLDAVLDLARDPAAAPEGRAAAEWALRRLAARIDRSAGEREVASPSGAAATADDARRAHLALAAGDIRRFLERRDAPTAPARVAPEPLRTPIGGRP